MQVQDRISHLIGQSFPDLGPKTALLSPPPESSDNSEIVRVYFPDWRRIVASEGEDSVHYDITSPAFIKWCLLTCTL